MLGRIKIIAILDDSALADDVRAELSSSSDVDIVATVEAALVHLRGPRDIDLALLAETAAGGSAVARAAALRRVRADLPVLALARVPENHELTAALRGKQVTEAVQIPWRRGELVAATERIREMSRLRRELDNTRREMHRRLETVSAMSELTAAIADAGSHDHLAQIIATGLFRIAPTGIGAAMLVVGDHATLHLHCHQPSGRQELNAIRDRCLETFRSLTGRAIPEDTLEVGIGGERIGPEGSRDVASVFTHVAIHLDAKIVGIVMVGASAGISPAEEKQMFLLAKRAAEIYRRLSAQQGKERRRLSRIVESLADGLIFVDARDERVLINPAAQRMLGIASDESASATIAARLGFRPLELVAKRPQSPAEPLREDILVDQRALRALVSPVHEDEGMLMGVVVLLRDVTREQELKRRQSEFMARISHELRTPLSEIAGVVNNMLSGVAGALSEKQERYLEAARESYSKLEGLVDNLLDAARSERNEILGQFTLMALDEVGQEVVARYRAEAEAKGIRVRLETPGKSVRILGDAERLTQALSNLLSNAIRFTPPGGDIEVEVFDSAAIADQVGVAVFNTGAPIPKEAHERVFAKFEQLESTATRAVDGAGLGLPLSRAIVEGHQGRIWAESLDRGTRFVFILPVTPTTEGADEERTLWGEGGRSLPGGRRRHAPSTTTAGSTTGASVLIVDDDRHASVMLTGILITAGYEVHVAEDADGALTLARSVSPALAVISTSMAEGEGADLIEIFTHDPDIRKTAVLVVSPSESAREPAMRANADEFLVMPLQQGLFLETCTRLIQDAGRVDAPRVLVVDDKATIRMLSRDALENAGYEVFDVADGASAIEVAKRFRPDVMLLDIMMPGMDGFTTAEKLKADPATSMTPIIFLSAKEQTEDKVRAFRVGAEDYMVKPVHPKELVARVGKAVERQARELGASPTTQLPGADAIEAEIEHRLALHGDDAFCYLDLDNLKAFNDYYGYAKADGVIRQIGDIIRDVIAREGRPGDFIGHIAGDDFVFITSADRVTKVCKTICSTFDRLIPLYYNKADRERGFIETVDRYGVMRQFPIMTVSVSVVTLAANPLKNYSDLAVAAAQGKKAAKELQGSSYVLDGKPIVGELACA